jgi:hypothetical protein
MANPTNIPHHFIAEEIGTPQPWELDAEQVVYEFMTAGGMNSADQVSDLLADDPNGADAMRELLAEWTLWCDLGDIKAAMERFIADRPDMDGE